MMKQFLGLSLYMIFMQICTSVCIDFHTLDHIRTKTGPDVQQKSVVDLIQRLIPNRYQEFSIHVDATLGPENKDTFRLSSEDDKVYISGSSGVAAAWGFYYYLSQYCGSHISWAGVQVHLPTTLPYLQSAVTVTSNDRFRYYQNVCTVSYSFAWWKWERWEQEIDWMAMNGINLPLAFNAQEAIWQRVYLSLGFSQKELDEHFGGPAFLAWSRMGNMRGWGGPLPGDWHSEQLTLQHRILTRMRELGMTPVLPAFAGHVPVSIIKHYPHANITRLADWGHFNDTYCCTALLDTNDPLFHNIGKAFIDEYRKEFGTDHIYNTDTFNEMRPKSSDPSYLHAASKAVYEAMLAGDPQAIWLMQGWLFLEVDFWGQEQIKALLTGVPQGKMIVLDLYSEVTPLYKKTHSYYGQPFIWCMLHDFGGTVAMYGAVESVNQGPFIGRDMSNSTMVGTGLTPEGINQNNVIYEFMLENSWRKQPRDILAWATNYARRRYGQDNPFTKKAWRIFMCGVYNSSHYHDGESDIFLVNTPLVTSPVRQRVWYNVEKFLTGWDYMITAATNLTHSTLFRYDLVDVSRQALQVISIRYYSEIVDAYKTKNLDKLKSSSTAFIELMTDLDGVLSTDEHFLLGAWLESAKSWSSSPSETALYEYNARTQVTTWGPTGEILDYANKQWSGLINGYYKPRWQLFVAQLEDAVQKGESYNRTKYRSDVFRLVEQPFTLANNVYPAKPQGDQIQMATAIHQKYRPASKKYAKFFKYLPKWSKKGKKFTNYASRWMRKMNYRTNDINKTFKMSNSHTL